MRMQAGGCRALAARSVSEKSTNGAGIGAHHTAPQLPQQPSEYVEPAASMDSYVVRPRDMSEMWKPRSPPTARMNAAPAPAAHCPLQSAVQATRSHACRGAGAADLRVGCCGTGGGGEVHACVPCRQQHESACRAANSTNQRAAHTHSTGSRTHVTV